CPLFPPPRNLFVTDPVTLQGLLFFCERRFRPRLNHVRRVVPPRKKMSRISRIRRPLPLLIEQSTRSVRSRLQHDVASRHYRRSQRRQRLVAFSPPPRNFGAMQVLDRSPSSRIFVR